MQSFDYVVKAGAGLHGRIAGALMRLVKNFNSDVVFKVGDNSSNLKKVLGVMNLSIQKGDRIMVAVEGSDEVIACDEIQHFLQENL